MNPKNTWIRILSLLLTLMMMLSSAAFAEDNSAGLPKGYFDGYSSISALFSAAEQALKDGYDPAAVKKAMVKAANELDMYPYFDYALENYVAKGNKAYNKLEKLFDNSKTSRYLNSSLTSDRSYVYDIDFDVYSSSEASKAFKSMISNADAQYCFSSYYLCESDFKDLYNKSFAKFVPTRSRPGYVCVVIKDNCESSPKQSWKKESSSEFRSPLSDVVDQFLLQVSDNGVNAPVITGNPNLASHFLVYEITYPFYAKYGTAGQISGYNCKVAVTLLDAKTHKEMAKYYDISELGDTVYVYSWSTTAQADMPDYAANSKFTSLTKNAAKDIRTKDNAAAASRPINKSNAKTVLDGILQEQAKKASAWEAAIYESGARSIKVKSTSVTFNLRSYNPKIKDLGSYSEAKNPAEWFLSALDNASKYNLTVTLKLKGGRPTNQALKDLKAAVQKAAKTAQSAFSSKHMTAALKDRLFPSPVDGGKASSSGKLLKPVKSFKTFYNTFFADSSLSVQVFSLISYGQKSMKIDVNEGPTKLIVNCVGLNPSKFISPAVSSIVKTMAYKPLSSRFTDNDPEETLLKKLAATSFSSHTDATYKYTLTMNIDNLKEGKQPSSYQKYLNRFNFAAGLESLTSKVDALPKYAAIDLPGTKLLSGGKSGGKLKITVPSNSHPTYIQVRKKGSGELAATMMIHPGKSLTFRVPSGKYYLVFCHGTYWYGEDHFFMEPDKISRSDPNIEVSTSYERQIELKAVSNGTIPIHGGSPSDLTKK